MIDSEKIRFDYWNHQSALKIGFQPPSIIHNASLEIKIHPILTEIDHVIERDIIEPMTFNQFKSLSPLKRYFLLYGLSGSGRTTNVLKIWKAYNTIFSNTVVYLRTDCSHWNSRPLYWTLIVNWLIHCQKVYPSIYLLLEVQYFDLFMNELQIKEPDVFQQLIHYPSIFIVATTTEPEKCQYSFHRRGLGSLVFISNPTYIEVSEWLKTLIYYTCDPENKFEMIQQRTIYDFDSWCEHIGKRIGRIDGKQVGVSISFLTNLLIPQFLNTLTRARLYWYNQEQKCWNIKPVYKEPNPKSKIEMTRDKLIEKLKRGGHLTQNEMRALNTLVLKPEDAEIKEFEYGICSKPQDVTLTWDWLVDAWPLVKMIGDSIFQYHVDPKEVKRYEELEAFNNL